VVVVDEVVVDEVVVVVGGTVVVVKVVVVVDLPPLFPLLPLPLETAGPRSKRWAKQRTVTAGPGGHAGSSP
jgi:hypothetical protein